MRRKPVSRNEVRFNGRSITTLPFDSVGRQGKWDDLKPIQRLWAPLLRSLNRVRKRDDAEKPETINSPVVRPWQGSTVCLHCEREFYRAAGGNSRYCSDRCANLHHAAKRATHNAERVKALSKARAEARADHTCANCGQPLTAQRSTRRFCSVRCRVAAHRARPASTSG